MNPKNDIRTDTNPNKKRKVARNITLQMYSQDCQQILPSDSKLEKRGQYKVGRKRKRGTQKTYDPLLEMRDEARSQDEEEEEEEEEEDVILNLPLPSDTETRNASSEIVPPPEGLGYESVGLDDESVGLDDDDDEDVHDGQSPIGERIGISNQNSDRASTNLDDSVSFSMSEDLGGSEENENLENENDESDGIDEEYEENDNSNIQIPKFEFNVNELYSSQNIKTPLSRNRKRAVSPVEEEKEDTNLLLKFSMDYNVISQDMTNNNEPVVQKVPSPPPPRRKMIPEQNNINNNNYTGRPSSKSDDKKTTILPTDFLFHEETEESPIITPIHVRFNEFPGLPRPENEDTPPPPPPMKMIDEDDDEEEEEEEVEEVINLNDPENNDMEDEEEEEEGGGRDPIVSDEEEDDEEEEDDDDTEMSEMPIHLGDEFEKLLLHPDWKDLPLLPEAHTPRELTVTLYPYQRQGVQWMISKENSSSKGGILADQLGLGKTIEILALFCCKPTWVSSTTTTTVKSDRLMKESESGPILIVTPQVIQKQWMRELQDRINLDLKIYHYHGPKRDKRKRFLEQQDVIVTTYSILTSEKEKGVLQTIRFSRVVIDEAHEIRSETAQKTKRVLQLDATYRWAVTGTPFSEKISQMSSFMKFLRHPEFSNTRKFHKRIRAYESQRNTKKEDGRREQLNRTLSNLLLRRSEVMVAPEINLKKRRYSKLLASFSDEEDDDEEKELYEILYGRCRQFILRMMMNEDFGKNFLKIRASTKVVQLCLLHFSLVLDMDLDECFKISSNSDDDDDDDDDDDEDSEDDSNRLQECIKNLKTLSQWSHSAKTKRIVEKIKEILKKKKNNNDDKILVFSQHMSFVEKLRQILNNENIVHEVLTGTNMNLKKKAEALDKLNYNESVKVLIVSVQTANAGLNLNRANHLIFAEPIASFTQELQATYRIWRIGQNKQTYFYHCVVRDTFEERLLKMQREKRSKIREAYGQSRKNMQTEKYSQKEFKYLFEIMDDEDDDDDDD